jgi:hypothetical protein
MPKLLLKVKSPRLDVKKTLIEKVWGFPYQVTIIKNNENSPKNLIHLWHIDFKYEAKNHYIQCANM